MIFKKGGLKLPYIFYIHGYINTIRRIHPSNVSNPIFKMNYHSLHDKENGLCTMRE